MTIIWFPKLNSPDIRRNAKRLTLGKVFHQEAVTNAVEEWLRESLRQDGKQFLVIEPVLKQRNRSIVWDLDAEVIIAMQHPHQLSTGWIFDETSDCRDTRAQIMAQEAGFKVEVSVTSYDLG